jgi:uncharacterized protein YbjT (DUF2867 family)
MYFVTGASGQTGSVVADSLLQAGKQVTVVLRDSAKGDLWRAKGAEVLVADLSDVATLSGAFAGADGVYAMIPPAYGVPDFLADRARVSDAVAAALKAAAPRHIVQLSSIGAQLPAGTGPILTNHYSEQVIPPVVANITILRCAYFIENWAANLQGVVAEGVLHHFFKPNVKFPMVSAFDIGAAAADLLQNPSSGRRIVELAGPEDYSPEDTAAALSLALAKPVTAMAHPDVAAAQVLQSTGMPASIASLFQDMIMRVNDGTLVFEGTGIRRGAVTLNEAIRRLVAR